MTAGHCCAGKCSANGVTDKTRIFAGGLSVSGFQDGGDGQVCSLQKLSFNLFQLFISISGTKRGQLYFARGV